ncbi:MAG: FAD:protein FMN transferase, partial [Desulfovibrio piger]|nr:FAD:protein FMN transferase [Desulfovibrio piger]
MPKTSRRDFLRWTLAGSGLLLAGAASVLEPAPARAVTRLGAPTQQTALFMGTMVSITVACPSSTQAHDAMDLAFAEGRRLEALLTRHDAAAPLGVLNSQGSLRDVPPELLNVWQRAHGICHLTGGAFDATVLPLVRLLESRSNPEGELELPESDLREALALVDTEAVYAGRDGMRLERQGMGLTLDGIAKGHIVDAMSAVLLRAGCENHLINAGGDILARGHKAPGVFWRVAVEDPEKRGHYPQVLELYNQAIATSGGYEMHYDAEGRHHHLLDPSTGRSPVLGSMSVLAATCMQA